MLIATRRRRGLARLGAALAIASALAMVLTGTPANAAGVSHASPAGSIVNGSYRWVDANSNLCLAYDPESRGAARQEGCGNDNTIFWDTVNTSGNSYELIDEHNGQCLSISGGSGADGAAAFVFTCQGTADQIFTLVPATSTLFAGAYQLVNLNSGKCVAVGGARKDLGAWVIQWSCAQSGEFMWRPI
ncbi:MAG TPA: RICIN domain-containing protein [Pseudonocardiaceae bacterium]